MIYTLGYKGCKWDFTKPRNSIRILGRWICMHNDLGLKEQTMCQEWWVAGSDTYDKMTKAVLGKVGSTGW